MSLQRALFVCAQLPSDREALLRHPYAPVHLDLASDSKKGTV